jgi:lipopolysaccharide/colanic/teichoic acid biosynthesis glycosyltransferase
MSNSKSSVTTSSTDAATESRIFGHRSGWDNFPTDHLRINSSGRNKYGETAVESGGSDAVTIAGLLGRQILLDRAQSEAKRPDRGLWLLCGSAIRKGHWEHLQEMSLTAINSRDLSTKYSPAIKRGCDLLGSLILLTLLSPLFVLIAILIKLDSPGSMLFRHHRVGKDGKPFLLLKFRSMKVNVPKYAVSPQSAADTRLTRIGRWIRRLSVDEMPQLVNVLKGEMSLVGPRPEMPFIVDSYGSVEYARFAVRPGITGLWQISPARAFPIHENLQYDFHYIQNHNLVFDCAIMLRTITAVIHGIGAV